MAPNHDYSQSIHADPGNKTGRLHVQNNLSPAMPGRALAVKSIFIYPYIIIYVCVIVCVYIDSVYSICNPISLVYSSCLLI